ncbi:MAG: hypothetical protein ACRD0G_10485 [Acidimicrobiales bacterium]
MTDTVIRVRRRVGAAPTPPPTPPAAASRPPTRGDGRRLRLVLAVALVVLLVGFVALVVGFDDGNELSTGPSTTVETSDDSRPPPTTTISTATSAVAGASESTENTTASSTATVQTISRIGPAAPSCRDDTSPVCGPFRWDPEPGPNAPMTITISAPVRAFEDESVRISVTFDDPDARPWSNCREIRPGSGPPVKDACGQPECPTLYGPHTPPARAGGSETVELDVRYDEPGTYTITAVGESASPYCGDPYGSTAHAERTIRIDARPPGPTNPSSTAPPSSDGPSGPDL